MSYLGIRQALFARLSGDDPTTSTILDKPSASHGMLYGENDPRRQAELGSKPIWHYDIPGCYHSVPVYPYNLAGTKIGAWPAVGIYLRYIRPRLKGGAAGEQLFSPEGDKLQCPVPGSEETIVFPDGTSVTRAGLVQVRKAPRAWDYRWDIRVDSHDEAELALIAEHILNLVGPIGYLNVTLRDGACASYNTYIDEPQFMRIPIGTLESAHLAEYALEIPLIVEGFEDNSMAYELRRLINKRALILYDKVHTEEPEARVEQGTPGYQICLLDRPLEVPDASAPDEEVDEFVIAMSGDFAGDTLAMSGDFAGFVEALSGDQRA